VADYLVTKSREKDKAVSVVAALYNVLVVLNVPADQSLMLETVVEAVVVVVAVVVAVVLVAVAVAVVLSAVVVVAASANNLVVATEAVPTV